MLHRFLACFLAACLLQLAAIPQRSDAQPSRDKTVWNYDGGVRFVTDGAVPNGPCFRLIGLLNAPPFFDNLRRVDSTTGTLFRRGNDIVTEFPERMELSFELHDLPCAEVGRPETTKTYLNREILRSLRVNFYWKHGVFQRPAREIVLKHAATIPIQPYARELSSEPLPPKYQWLFDFDVPSAGVPLTDSLVIVLESPEGKIVSRCAARM